MAIELEKHQERSYELRKRKHKQITVIITVVLVLAAILVISILVKFIIHKDYTNYKVIHTTKRSDTSAAAYENYGHGVIRYSRDGAMAMDGAGNLLWNGTYEMKDPVMDVCDNYAVVSDRGYKTVQIFDGKGGMTTINMLHPIFKAEVANQGVTAVLMNGKNEDYLNIYDENGETLAETRTINKKDGYPLDFTLSDDGRKIATSYLSVHNGQVQSKIAFRNFGGVGQNYEDKVVGGFDFGKSIVPKIDFINNTTVCAFGDNKFRIYTMEETPSLTYEETFKTDIKSIFYNDDYIGFVLMNGDKDNKYRILLYNTKGKKLLDKGMNYEYNNISVSGDEIIMYSNLEWMILNANGTEKFHYKFDKDVSYILPVNNKDKYILIDNNDMQEIKLIEGK